MVRKTNRLLSGLLGGVAVLTVMIPAAAREAQAITIDFDTIALSGQLTERNTLFTGFSVPRINDRGAVAFIGRTTPEKGAQNDSGVFRGDGEVTDLVAFEGDATPEGGEYESFGFRASIADNGDVAFFATTTPTPAKIFSEGIFRTNGVGEAIQTVVFEGDLAPTGSRYARLGKSPVINSKGEVGFHAETGLFIGADRTEGIFVQGNAAASLVAVEGEIAPDGKEFSGFSQPDLNEGGAVVFTARTGGDGNDGTEGVFRSGPGPLETVAQIGDATPDSGNGQDSEFNRLPVSGAPPRISDTGGVAFGGTATGKRNGFRSDAIVSGLPEDGKAFSVRTNDRIETLPGFQYFFQPTGAVMNDSGDLAFSSRIMSDTLFGLNDAPDIIGEGLFLASADFPVIPVLLAQQLLEVAPGDVRRVSGVGKDVDLSDTGVIAFQAFFEGGSSGLFTASVSVSQVPVPAALPLLAAALGAIGVVGYRRRRR